MTVIAISIFFVIWNSRAFVKNNYFLVLCIAYLIVAGSDFLHALAGKEMGLFPVRGSHMAEQPWIASRYLESISWLAAPLFVGRNPRLVVVFAALLLIAASILGTIFCWKTFLQGHVEGIGPTQFKATSDYTICFIFLASIGMLLKHRDQFYEGVPRLMVLSIIFSICSEMTFLFSVTGHWSRNLIADCFKIISFFMIFVAATETGLRRPYDIELTELKQEQGALRKVNERLKREVKERTLRLRRANEKDLKEVVRRRKAEEDLKESEERFRTLMEFSPIGITIFREGRRQYVNPAVLRMFGYESEQEILELHVTDLYEPESGKAIKSLLMSDLEGMSVPYRQEAKGVKKNGQTIDVSIWMAKTAFQGVPVILSFERDLSEENSLRSQLFRAQKMESFGTLAGGIAHDFNNLLTIILGYSELLLSSKTEPATDDEDIRRIAATAEKGADLVRRILTFTRKVESRPRPINLSLEVGQFKKFLERTISKMIVIDLRLADDLKWIDADPAEIEQVLMNLAVNAQHAMSRGEGGTLALETENVVLDEEHIKTHLKGDPGEYVVLRVSDTGHGMEREVREHVFEPFFTTKEAGMGTGLGLAIVYGIVTRCGGHIQCYSEPGLGTTFEMYFPAIEKETEPSAEELEAVTGGDGETILLVDDEESIRDLATRILSGAGYTILTAESGQDALEVYRNGKRDIELVILNLVMPYMGGRECLEELLKIDRKAKVILISGFAADNFTRDTLKKGARAFLSKPFTTTEMLKTIRRLLDES